MKRIQEYLTGAQIGSIINAIYETCNKYKKVNKQFGELFYEPYTNHRDQQSLTCAVISRFAPKRINIEGLESKNIAYGANLSFAQPEIFNEKAVFHIYSSSNSLQSQIVRECCEKNNNPNSEKLFFVIQFEVNAEYELEKLWVKFFDSQSNIVLKEVMYQRPLLVERIA